MKWPRLRLSVRQMMIGVAVLAVAFLVARYSWERWLRRSYLNPLKASMDAKIQLDAEMHAGRPIPVVIHYDYQIGNPKLPPGTIYYLWAGVWFADRETGFPVEGYSFVAPLTVAGREAASGSFIWNALMTEPGMYSVHHSLRYKPAFGEWQGLSGGTLKYVRIKPSSENPAYRGAEDAE